MRGENRNAELEFLELGGNEIDMIGSDQKDGEIFVPIHTNHFLRWNSKMLPSSPNFFQVRKAWRVENWKCKLTRAI